MKYQIIIVNSYFNSVNGNGNGNGNGNLGKLKKIKNSLKKLWFSNLVLLKGRDRKLMNTMYTKQLPSWNVDSRHYNYHTVRTVRQSTHKCNYPYNSRKLT